MPRLTPSNKPCKRLAGTFGWRRLRREKTIAEVAERIGTGPRAVRNAEKGKASTGVTVYAALLWAYDLLAPFDQLADPITDKEGLALAAGQLCYNESS